MPSQSTDMGAEPKLRLSQQDVEKLLKESSSGARVTVLEKIAINYDAGGFETRELLIAEQIFRLLLKDTEIQVRKSLAEHLKENSQIPRDIILGLAKDVEEVALPLLRSSEVLSDADLIEIIRTSRGIAKSLAVSQRKIVSPRVSEALIDTNSEEVVAKLVQNQGAEISDSSYRKILQDFSNSNEVLSHVVGRESLPITVVEKLITQVSGQLAEELQKKYKVSIGQFAQETEQTRESATLKLLECTADIVELEKLANQLLAYNRLTPSLVFTALCRGNFDFFEVALAKLARIPTENARLLIKDRGELGFKGLYTKAGLPDSLFSAARIVLLVVREMAEGGEKSGNKHFSNRLVEKILYYSEGKEIENLSYIIALIRQNNATK